MLDTLSLSHTLSLSLSLTLFNSRSIDRSLTSSLIHIQVSLRNKFGSEDVFETDDTHIYTRRTPIKA